jgi:hypothetical protein
LAESIAEVEEYDLHTHSSARLPRGHTSRL